MKIQDRRLPTEMVKRPTPREQAREGGWMRFPDRREERGVECCLKQKGAYYGDRTAPAQLRRCPHLSGPGIGDRAAEFGVLPPVRNRYAPPDIGVPDAAGGGRSSRHRRPRPAGH